MVLDAFVFASMGGEIVEEQKYSAGDKDFKAQLTSIKAKNPEAIFIPGYYTDVNLISIQAREIGLTCPLFGSDGWESEKLTEGKAKDAAWPLSLRRRTRLHRPSHRA